MGEQTTLTLPDQKYGGASREQQNNGQDQHDPDQLALASVIIRGLEILGYGHFSSSGYDDAFGR